MPLFFPPTPGGNVFVFQPGGTAGGNVFTTWGSLMGAVGAVRGLRTIQFDESFGFCVIPAGAWDMTDVTLAGAVVNSLTPHQSDGVVSVTVNEGATFLKLRSISAVHVQWGGLTPPVADFSALGEVFLMDQGAYIDAQTATGPFFTLGFSVTDTILSLRNGSNVFLPAVPVFELTDFGSKLTIEGGIGALLPDNSVVQNPPGGGTLHLVPMASSAHLSNLQAGFVGSQLVVGTSTNPESSELRLWPRNSEAVDGNTSPITATTVFAALAGDLARCDPSTPSGGSFALPLPAANTCRGAIIVVKIVVTEAGRTVTITPTGGDTIDGAATLVLAAATLAAARLVSDGISKWLVF